MKTIIVTLLILATTNVLGQNPYEYIDDELLQKVGQIVYEYDQQVAASRSGGSASSNIASSRSVNDMSGGYQMGKRERVARVTNFGYENNNPNSRVNYAPQQQQTVNMRQYNQVQRQSYSQPPQHNYQVNRNQRQLTAPAAPLPVARNNPVQSPAQVGPAYQAPRPVFQTYQSDAPFLRTYQEPKVVQQQPSMKNAGFSAYSLSQPEAIARVAEFHFTDGQQSQNNDNFYSSSVNNREVAKMQGNSHYRLA